MLLLRFAGIFSIGLIVLVAGVVCGQDFPDRPIRIITSLPGGGSDFTSRLIAQGISGPLGQPVIVENRPSNLTGETAMKALPDGYTLLVEGNSFWFAPFMKSGKLKALAVTSAKPSPLLPNLPTIASAGLPGYELVTRHRKSLPPS